MSFLTENIIPNNHGKIFATNATEDSDMLKIKQHLLKLDGITDVHIVSEVFPKEFIVKTSKVIKVHTIQNAIMKLGLHAIPKGLFPL